jgi:hypothetical protein
LLSIRTLPALEARARYSFMLIAGAVVVASALSQAIAHPVYVDQPTQFLPMRGPIAAPAPVVTPIAAPAAAPSFDFRAPTPGYPVNSPFGLRRLPWEPRGRMHEGVDIAAPAGLPVGATLAGVVLKAGLSPTYGRFVEVRHADGLTSLYGHLGSIGRGVKPGVALAAGQAVGLVGNTGRSTGEHLHFEIRSEGKPLNPALFIGQSFASVDDLPLSDAARFSRKVRLAVVSEATMARMMPKAAAAKGATPQGAVMAARKDGRVHATLAPIAPTFGDPSPAAMAAAAQARGIVLDAPVPQAALAAPIATTAG